MSRQRWRADPLRSYQSGLDLRDVTITAAAIPGIPPERLFWAELVFVSICHSTNWDRLHRHVLQVATDNWDRLAPPALSAMAFHDFSAILGPGFDERVLDQRARWRTVREVADAGCRYGFSTSSEGSDAIARRPNPEALQQFLAGISAFTEDPLQKKARILIQQLTRLKVLELSSNEEAAPAVDYHLMRLYMRSGRVVLGGVDSLKRYQAQFTARESLVERLRRAVEDAMWYTAAGSGLSITDLNHVEWQLARSLCCREGARCSGVPAPYKPLDQDLQRVVEERGGCLFADDCPGARDPEYRMLIEPRLSRSYY